MAIDLSILICSTHTRSETFGRAIQKQVWSQYEALPREYRERIEILMLTDNKTQMLGHKRNVMVDMAQGRYIQFIDDDDRIEPDMFRSVLDATATDADAITFLVSVSLNGARPKICRYSKDFTEDRNTAQGYERLPNHICCVKRDLALQISFPHLLYGEDSGYAKLLRPLLATEHHIPRVLYHYDYSVETTEAQEHLRNQSRHRPGQLPLVDVVILSNANTKKLRQFTQRTIDTCLAGSNGLAVGVTVMEQWHGTRYRNATTVHMPADFNYNGFANAGATRGSADWIIVANNDLMFHDGWLHQLLAANHPLVSPKCPRDERQRRFTENTCGYDTGRHLSGWCFMISRNLWNQIGGFDEAVTFWCSDDAVIEQVRAVGVSPMLVTSSLVEHVQSSTLKSENRERHDELTWQQVDIFINKYGSHQMQNNPGYINWKKQRATRGV